jgi:hypothetical protein
MLNTRLQIWKKSVGWAAFIAACLACSIGHAQAPVIVRGKVIDSSGSALSNATVSVLLSGDSISTLTKEDGAFVLYGVRERSFTLKVTMKGYTPWSSHFDIKEDTAVILIPPISLQPQYQELTTVYVAQSIPVTIRGDTLEYHASAFHLREGSLLEDLMPQLPGITIQPDSGLLVMGQKVKKLLLDGKAFYGSDVQAALKTLPYNIIDKVEVIDDYGDESHLTGIKTRQPDKVLNITLKKDRSNGLTGILEGGGGNEGQYIGNINANLFKEVKKFSLNAMASNLNSFGSDYIKSLGGNYADQWGRNNTISLLGNTRSEHRMYNSSTMQDSYFTSGYSHLQQGNISDIKGVNHHGEHEWQYGYPTSQTLKLTSLFDLQTTDEQDVVNLASQVADSGFSKQTSSNNLNHVKATNLRSDNRLYFSQVLPHSRQRFSLEATVNYLQNDQQADYLSRSYVMTDSSSLSIQQHYRISNNYNSTNINSLFRYYLPLGKNGFIELHYGLHSVRQQNRRTWQQQDPASGNWTSVDTLNKNFIYQNVEHTFYGGYTHHADKLDIITGVTAAPGELSGRSEDKTPISSYHYFRLLPEVDFTYHFTSFANIGLTWNSQILPPAISQVIPVTDISNPQYPTTGNPDLKPTVKQSINLQYENNKVLAGQYHGFSIWLTYSTLYNQVVPNQVHPHDNSTIIQHTYFENANGNNDLRISGYRELPFHHWKLLLGGSTGITRAIFLTDSVHFVAHTLSYAPTVTLQYNKPDLMDFKWTTVYEYAITNYVPGTSPAFSSTVLTSRINQTLYLFHYWKLGYALLLKWNSITDSRLQPAPVYLSAQLERAFLKHHQLNFRLTAANLLNVQSSFNQSSTPNTVTQNSSSLLGRNFFLSVRWMFEKFRQKK